MMWRSGIMIAAALLTLLPTVASATVYTFHDTESSALSPSPVIYTFSLDTTVAVGSAGGATFNNVVIDENGAPSSGNSIGATFGTYLGSPLFFLIDTSLEPFYSGSGTGINFNAGTFSIADGATDGEGILTISANAVSPAPEPASWTLMLTGGALAAAAGCFYRKSKPGSGLLA
jgi:hypothetical protein